MLQSRDFLLQFISEFMFNYYRAKSGMIPIRTYAGLSACFD